MIFDSRQQVSFVQADIEIGQKYRGLYQSSQKFLQYYDKNKKNFNFKIESIGQVSELINHETLKLHSVADFNKFPSVTYKYLSELCYLGLLKNKLCLNFGGDHSIALSSVHASLKYDPDVLVIWIDAHPDINDAEHSFSGHFHGMPVQYLIESQKRHPKLNWMSQILPSNNIIYIGLRDIDEFELQYLNNHKIEYYSSQTIFERGLKSVLNLIADKIESHENIHLSFDIDSLDRDLNLCTGVPVPHGLQIHHLKTLAEFFQRTNKLKSIDIVEINPDLAQHQTDLDDVFQIVQHFLNHLISPIPVDLTKDKQIENKGDFNDRFF